MSEKAYQVDLLEFNYRWWKAKLLNLMEKHPEETEQMFKTDKEGLLEIIDLATARALEFRSRMWKSGMPSHEADSLMMETMIAPSGEPFPDEDMSEEMESKILKWAEQVAMATDRKVTIHQDGRTEREITPTEEEED